MNEQPQSQGEQLIRAIAGFPKFLVGFLSGFLVIVLIELDMLALLLAAVALGFAVESIFWPIFFFLVAWVLLRALSALPMIGQAIQNLANVMRQFNPQPPISPEP